MRMERDKIKLNLINGRAMTFNADDYMKLRTEHRIIGRLIGVAPPYPRNVNLLHLPAVYSEFECSLMLQENIADIQEMNSLIDSPNKEVKDAFTNYQNSVIDDIMQPYIKSKLESTIQNMDQIIEGKKRKLIKSGVPKNEIKLNREEILKEEEEKYKQTFNTQNLYSQVPTQHPFLCPTQSINKYHVKNKDKNLVFHDLWKKDLYVTSADNFGGDFLTYSGDPMYFHATQIVHIINRDDLLEPHFLSSCGRLSVSVKKKCVFAYIHNEKVVYQTLEWDNPKLRSLNVSNDTNDVDSIDEEEDLEY